MPRLELLSIDDREPHPEAALLPGADPSCAQMQLWLAQAHRDRGNLSSRELARIEGLVGSRARLSIAFFNPFTGEIRKTRLAL